MKKSISIVFVLFFSLNAMAQDCDSLLKKATLLIKVTKYKEALDTALLAEKVCSTDTSLLVKYAEALMDIGLIWQLKGDVYKAIKYHDSGLAVYKEHFDTLNDFYLKQLISNGLMYKEAGNFNKAISIFQKIADSYKWAGRDTTQDYYSARLNIVQTISGQGYLDKANKLTIDLVDQYITKFGKQGYYYYVFINELAFSFHKLGENEKAIAIYEAEMPDVRDTSQYDRLEYMDVPNNLAYIYYSLGILDKAIYINEIFLEYKKIHYYERPMDYAWTANHLGAFYTAKGEFEKAEEYLLKAAEIRKRVSGVSNLHYGFSLNNIGKLYYKWGKYDKAIAIQKNLLEETKGNPLFESQFVATYMHNYAQTLCRLKQYDSAIVYFKGALAIRKELYGEQHLAYLETLNALSQLYIEIHQFPTAKNALIGACELLKNIFKNSLTYFTANNQRQFIENNLTVFDLYNSVLFKQADSLDVMKVYSNVLFLKSLSLNTTINNLRLLRNVRDSSIMALLQNWLQVKNYLSKQYTQPLANQANDLKDKEYEAQRLEQNLYSQSAAFRNYDQSINISAANIYRVLKPGEAAIEFTSFRYYGQNGITDSILYNALILTPKDSIPQSVFLCEEKQIMVLLKEIGPNKLYANSSVLPGIEGLRGDILYNLLWKKIEPYCKNVSTIYFSPSGILSRIAFAALPVPGTKLALCKKYKMVQLSNTEELLKPQINNPLSGIALMGGINYDADSASFAKQYFDTVMPSPDIYFASIYSNTEARAGNDFFKPINATLAEVKYIEKIANGESIKTTLFSGYNASEEQFKKFSGNAPSVVHIATHGFYRDYLKSMSKDAQSGQTNFSLIEDPMFRSGIALAGANLKWHKNIDVPNREDGIVTAYDVAQMDLAKTELVVLSACESGLGDIGAVGDVYGLQRGFKSAGVSKMIISLWKIPDVAGMEFMTSFYTKWLKEKNDIRTAFYNTQLYMYKKYPDEPQKWAGFVLVE